jgi:hypothetical protein
MTNNITEIVITAIANSYHLDQARYREQLLEALRQHSEAINFLSYLHEHPKVLESLISSMYVLDRLEPDMTIEKRKETIRSAIRYFPKELRASLEGTLPASSFDSVRITDSEQQRMQTMLQQPTLEESKRPNMLYFLAIIAFLVILVLFLLRTGVV